jgi:hypothetical protein
MFLVIRDDPQKRFFEVSFPDGSEAEPRRLHALVYDLEATARFVNVEHDSNPIFLPLFKRFVGQPDARCDPTLC